ncbi:MAG: hypothetical protein IT581_15405 [Verrucomicrobiales bacterium]|nr:hypothetical protein [Verrucomicrobiales bacterium]
MRILSSLAFLGGTFLISPVFGQAALPGAPEDNGLKPVSETVYVNTTDTLNNTKTESLGVAIARNGNVVVGWEDDGEALSDLEAVWTLYDRDGKSITPDTEITSVDPSYAGQTLTSKFLSFFRKDKSAVSGRTGWGPKIKANLFGAGFGMGVTGFDVGLEVTEFAGYQDAGDYPAVQLVGNAGDPLGIVMGVSQEYGARDPGNIRIGDFEYLSNGNIVIAGESRQTADLVDVYSGESAQNHVVIRIVDPTGKEVKAAQLAGAAPTKTEMWHGLGVTKNGFAVRFSDNGPGAIRLFDNAGTPVSTNIDLATLVGNPIAGGGGRGDGVGFHGNGNDAYASAAIGKDADGKNHVWVSVLSTNGTVRWSKSVSDDIELLGPGRCDVAIDALGRVAVVYDDAAGTGGNAKIILGRVFDPQGKPLGKTFYVSEKELPVADTLESRNARVAFRDDSVAVTWESQTSSPGTRVVALRLFVLPVKPGSIESVGLTRVVPDTVVINQSQDALGNWEPFASVLGTSTFLVEANAFAQDSADAQRYVVAFQPAAGGAMKLGEGFYADNGTPFTGQINASRQNGNPGRVAGDKRPGAVNFIVGAEASPHVYEQFQSGNRWNGGFDRLDDGRYGTVQTFKLDTATLTQTPLSLAQDSAHGRRTTGAAPGNQISRFGGDVVGLSDGNFLSVVEDRSLVLRPDGNAAVATIFSADGKVVKEAFKVADGDLWANVVAYKGGFAVRVAGKIYFYNNAGEQQGDGVDQDSAGETFDRGRGDGVRMGGHINSPFVYMAGKVTTSAAVRLAVWDSRTRAAFGVANVSEDGFRAAADRSVVAVDALDRIIVAWASQPDGYEQQQVAARVMALDEAAKTITPLTASFLPFVNQAPVGGIRSVGMSVAMTTKQLLVAAKGEINLQNQPGQGVNSPREINFYTVISHPSPKDDPTPAVGSGGGDSVSLTVTRNGGNLTITSSPQPLPTGFVLELGPSVTGPWVSQGAQNTPVTVPIGNQSAVFLRAVKR